VLPLEFTTTSLRTFLSQIWSLLAGLLSLGNVNFKAREGVAATVAGGTAAAVDRAGDSGKHFLLVATLLVSVEARNAPSLSLLYPMSLFFLCCIFLAAHATLLVGSRFLRPPLFVFSSGLGTNASGEGTLHTHLQLSWS
jgi:hypothetical protein